MVDLYPADANPADSSPADSSPGDSNRGSEPPSRAGTERSRIAALGALVLALVSAGALWFTLDPGVPEPTDAQWRAAGEHIAARAEAGDGIRVHPFWIDAPHALIAPFDGEAPAVDVSLPPDPLFDARHRRIWVVSALGRDDAPTPAGELVERTELDGHLTVALYRLPASPVVADLLDRLSTARVERREPGKGAVRRCRWTRDHHDCRGKAWENVAVGLHQVGGAPRRCAVLHPFPNRGTVRLTWPKVRLDGGLLFRTGFTLEAARNEKGSDATVRFFVDDALVAERKEPRNAWEWTPIWVETANSKGRTADVSVEVTARDEQFRDLCLDAWVLSRPL